MGTKAEKEEKGSWGTDTGLPDDFDFWITSAYFGYRAEYMDGAVPLLIWEGESPDEESQSIIWPCGSGWDVSDGGNSVYHQKRKRFVKVSMIGRLIDRVVEELGVNMSARGEATEAKSWKSLGFHMKREEIEFGPGIMEDKGGKTTHLMPVAFLGEQKSKAAATARTILPVPTKTADEPSTDLLQKKLAALASKLSLEEFQKRAIDMEDVIASDELTSAVLDDTKDGFWAQHQKEGA